MMLLLAAIAAFLFLIYNLVDRGWQNYLLLGVNLVFIASVDLDFAALLFSSSLFAFLVAHKIENPDKAQSKTYLRSGLIVFAGIFILTHIRVHDDGILKGFFSAAHPSRSEHGAFAVSAAVSVYTLALVGYLIDVYRKRSVASKDLSEFLLFTTFFPLILVGPIERYYHLGPQFNRRRNLTLAHGAEGMFLLGLGLLKTSAISDPLLKMVDHLDPATDSLRGFGLLLYCFVAYVQIYAGFSGAIDLARGIAKMLGINLFKNFDEPYLSSNIVEAWQKWHMTLISWLKDFIYLPILFYTKNIYFSISATILFAGLWHDFSFRYIYWSIYWIILSLGYVILRQHGWLGMASPVSRFFRRFVSIARIGTLSLVGLSTLVFMILPGRVTLMNLLSRIVDLRPQSIQSISGKTTLSLEAVFLIGLSTIVVIFMDRFYAQRVEATARSTSFIILAIFLMFMVALAGTFKATEFMYLRY